MAGLLQRLVDFVEKRTTLSRPAQWLIDWVSSGAETVAGVKVNHETTWLMVLSSTIYADIV